MGHCLALTRSSAARPEISKIHRVVTVSRGLGGDTVFLFGSKAGGNKKAGSFINQHSTKSSYLLFFVALSGVKSQGKQKPPFVYPEPLLILIASGLFFLQFAITQGAPKHRFS